MRLQALALAAGLAGLAISIYLTVVHFSTIPLACPANSVVNCEQVLSSPYAVIAGSAIPTSAAGIVWFAVSALLAAGQLAGRTHLSRVQLGWSAVGLVTVLWLVFVEIVELGAVCLWCSAGHVLVLLIFLVSLPRANGGRVGS
ncbi:MAG: vitamin K epoxide reductase family protein [Candidatus Dormibacteraceae bacterium]